MATNSNFQNNFAEGFSKHPHRRIQILLSILTFVFVVAGITLYQMKLTSNVVPSEIITESSPSPDPRIPGLMAINEKRGNRVVSQADVIEGLKAINAKRAAINKRK